MVEDVALDVTDGRSVCLSLPEQDLPEEDLPESDLSVGKEECK